MKLRDSGPGRVKRTRSLEALVSPPPLDDRLFSTERDLTKADKKNFVRYVTEAVPSRNPVWIVMAISGSELVLLFPEVRSQLPLDDHAFVSMKAEADQKRNGRFNNGRFFAEIAAGIKILFPNRVEGLELDETTWEGIRKAVVYETAAAVKKQVLRPPEEHLLTTLSSALILYPEKTRALVAGDNELLDWARSTAQAKLISGPMNLFMYDVVFSDILGETEVDEELIRTYKKWFETARKISAWPQFIKAAAGMKLLTAKAVVNSAGFIEVPRVSKLGERQGLPARLSI